MIGRPARCERCNALEAELGEIQPIDKDIDRPNRIVLAYILIQHRGKQRALLTIRPLNKALHPIPANRRESYRANQSRQSVFTQPGPEAVMHTVLLYIRRSPPLQTNAIGAPEKDPSGHQERAS
jgi:hypothetical protein